MTKTQHDFGTSTLARLALKEGAERIDSDVYPALRKIIEKEAEQLMRDALSYMRHTRKARPRMMKRHIRLALKRRGRVVFGG